jgi:antirestriction protein
MTKVTLFAQPYDITATGFYFETVEQYEERTAKARNDFGQPVEEFEIQFIDGEALDCALAVAWGVNQADFPAYLEAVEEWEDERKRRYIIAVGECGYDHADVADDPDHNSVDIYYLDNLRDLAESFVDDGLFGDIPVSLQAYIDYDAIARDLSADFSEMEIAGERIVYACR